MPDGYTLEKVVKIAIDFIHESMRDPLWCGGVLVIIGFFLWKWGIKKLFSFIIVAGALLFLMFWVDSFIVRRLGEEGNSFTLLVKPFFGFIIGALFLYYCFVRSDS